MSQTTPRDPIRCVALLEAGEGVSPEVLQSEWLASDPLLEPHGRGADRYVRTIPLASDERGFRARAVYGIAQFWVDGWEQAGPLCAALEALPQTAASTLLRNTRITALPMREFALIDGPERRGGADGVKAFYFAGRKPGMSTAAFQDHWLNVHGPLVTPSPGITRYVQCHPCPEACAIAEPRYDSLGELTFPDKAAQAEFGASEMSALQGKDTPNLWDMTGRALRFYVEDQDEVGGAHSRG